MERNGDVILKPTIGESAKGWRLSPKRRSLSLFCSSGQSPYSLHWTVRLVKSKVWRRLQRTPLKVRGCPTRTPLRNVAGFGFVPQTISGDARLSSNEISMFGGQAKSVQADVGDVQGQQGRWLQPNRTVVLDNGTVIHAKVAKRLVWILPHLQNLPLSWTLKVSVEIRSSFASDMGKARVGKPQVKASPDFWLPCQSIECR